MSIANKYRVEKLIGSGAFGEIYKGNSDMNDIAIKIVHI